MTPRTKFAGSGILLGTLSVVMIWNSENDLVWTALFGAALSLLVAAIFAKDV